ncbi:acyltransferase [Pseudomonas sp. SGAir0191]|uniref:acyltransferase family protein n=1 Tax=Pseudomonas sp. SGAir0191 TaxID=2217867 RepID=UPI000C2C7428|nr:acyltransferase family protein [Pseudomonas sp. SGAir0191]AUA33031.1 acyltransferase [Pseudomonas sp. SGAir0191]
MLFHKNINALRALAVVSVVLYHFKIPGFSAGFLGVDVFFVISGYLMTRIIVSGLHKQQFSLIGFYAARARRIIPALLGLCIALAVFGYFFLATEDYRELLRTSKESLLFTSNHYFARDGSYFDAPLQENWLLHTWSLSVEWQFYLIYPVIVMGLHKVCAPPTFKRLVLALGAGSLMFSALYSPGHPVASFFLLPTRAWEMLAGGLVFLYPLALSPRAAALCEGLGLALIAGALALLPHDATWPGYLALIPVIGTLLVIHANANSLFARNRALAFLGKTSYSIYLWHWPLVVLLYTCGLLQDWRAVTCAVLLSVALGAASYGLIESRTRALKRPVLGLARYAGMGLVWVAAAGAVASAIKHNPQLRWAHDDGKPEYDSKLYAQHCDTNPYGAAQCVLGSGDISALLLGDSHAQSTAAALMLENPGAAMGWARAGCPTLIDFEMGDKDVEQHCKAFNADKFAQLATDYPGVPLFLFSRAALYTDQRRHSGYSVYFNGDKHQSGPEFERQFIQTYTQTVCMLAQNRPVYIVKPVPEMPFSVYKGLTLQHRLLGMNSDIVTPVSDYQARNRLALEAIETAAERCHAGIVDPVPYLCPDGKCMGSKDGRPLYFDDNHLIDAGNEQLKGLFKQAMHSSPGSTALR